MALQFYNSVTTSVNSGQKPVITGEIARNKQFYTELSELGKNLLLYEQGKLLTDPTDLLFLKKEAEAVPHKNIPWNLYKETFKRVPLVYNSIRNTTDFAIQAGFELEGSADAIEKVEKWFDKVNFESFILPIIFDHMQTYGVAYMEITDINNPKMLPPETMFVKATRPEGNRTGYVQKIHIDDKLNPTWTTDQIIQFIWNPSANQFYGMSDIHPALGALQRHENWMLDLGQILHRFAAPILHWKVGLPDIPATQQQLDDFKATIENRLPGEDIITSAAIESTVAGDGKMKMIQPDNLVNSLENAVIAAMRSTHTFARGGESSNKATALVELEAFERKIGGLVEIVVDFAEDFLFPKITGRKSDIKMKWNKLSPEGELVRAQRVQLFNQAGIPADIALRMVGMGTWADDVKKVVDEKQQQDIQQQKELVKMQPKVGQSTSQQPSKTGARKL